MKAVQRVVVALAIGIGGASTADDFVTPGDSMTLSGIPPIPKAIAEKADRYTQYRTARFAQWHPERLEMLITTRFGDASQVHHVAGPGAARRQLTFFAEPIHGVSSYVARGGDFFTYRRDVGGSEFFQIYRYDLISGESTRLTDGVKRNTGGEWSEKAGVLAYARVDADAEGAFTEIRVVDPLRPESDRVVTRQRGGGWMANDWSPDGRWLACTEYHSINASNVWLVNVESGETRHLLPPSADDRPIAYRDPAFSADGRGLYVTTDASSEFRQLTYIPLDSLRHQTLTGTIDWDVDRLAVSEDRAHIAYTVNVGGTSVLHLLATETGRSVRVAGAPAGVIGALGWHDDNEHLAFTVTSARVPGDVYVLHAPSGAITRWTHSETGGLDTSDLPTPERIAWQSFDGRTLSGFLYRPPARFGGKRPVIVSIHGGPESQARPRFQGRWNYFTNELGVAIVLPNVRGSGGYGKSFLRLDNGMLREGTYRDIGALLDWIGTRDNLDEERILVYGGSYGGHMTLATATRYSDRIACSVELFGLSNLRTFLENTEGYRRDLRRVEYGDERDPEIRAWMDRTAPMTLVRNIRKPILIQQGANDPRVPKSESDQIVASLREVGTPTGYLVFADEGHGWRKKSNADFAFYTIIRFAEQCLLE